MTRPVRVGDLRPSQLLHTFGVGAVIDLPELSAIVSGIDDWPVAHADPVSEERLLAAVRRRLGPQVEALRSPPYTPEGLNPFEFDATIGVPVVPFPRWLRCPRCRLLAPIENGLFQLRPDRYRPDRVRFIHDCTTRGRPPTALAARFLLACRRGHHDDFPWIEYAHKGKPCERPTLRLTELGAGGQAAEIEVRCTNCDANRRMSDAFGPNAAGELPRCRGRHPHLGTASGDCAEEPRTILLGASNSWFPVSLSVLSVPSRAGVLDQLVEDRWAVLQDIDSPGTLAYALRRDPELVALRAHPPEDVWDAIASRRDGGAGGDEPEDLRTPEWEVLSRPLDAPRGEDFRLSVRPVPRGFGRQLAEVVLAERLREVVALIGFTRVEAPGDAEPDEASEPAPISRTAPRWVPCAEVRGEGIFLRLPEPAVTEWEDAYERAGRARMLQDAHAAWRRRRALDPARGWPGTRYVLLHTLAHALMRELALECGYGASALRERIYATPPGGPPMAGILLYTAAPDSEGTLGGLVGLGAPEELGRLLTEAVEHARLCSADPLCAEHDPAGDGSLHGAACHACQFAAETSCERGNRYLDRAALVGTFAVDGPGYFGR